ncbi:unknown protein [Seminavis robusta]|uniref:Uncharacterized protein n=1 Tax=Seminavis robusta TaxID=568900 RepID=A0A9N8EQ09_9STRA|nr:unknown protein [Seminavis robusta]|eukprot:Sro1641_g287990.1 n/a (196) ;mRNA; r:13672-14259
MDNDRTLILHTGSFDAACNWKPIVVLSAVNDFENMSDEDRTVAICLETYDGKLRNYRGTASFDRFDNTASYAFHLSVRKAKHAKHSVGSVAEVLNDTVDQIEIRLTSRFTWEARAEKVKGTETKGRWITLCFNRDEDAQTPNSIKQIDLIIPKSKTSDNGKLLALAIKSAKHVVEAKIAEEEFQAAKNALNAMRL